MAKKKADKKKKVTLSISKDNAEKLKRVAALRRMTQSEIVDNALSEEFGEISEENLGQVDAKIAQVVGPVKRSRMIQGNSSVRDALMKSREAAQEPDTEENETEEDGE